MKKKIPKTENKKTENMQDLDSELEPQECSERFLEPPEPCGVPAAAW